MKIKKTAIHTLGVHALAKFVSNYPNSEKHFTEYLRALYPACRPNNHFPELSREAQIAFAKGGVLIDLEFPMPIQSIQEELEQFIHQVIFEDNRDNEYGNRYEECDKWLANFAKDTIRLLREVNKQINA